ncbi:Ser/Thr protein kinase RdoA (MazF antagonist) [Actinoalloteichus hoggarensis]|uniref:Phosphotransferase enzyme family protein n=1 Tax=Actinoalloteichus hoggarensis TaxID=1470176 RepID=A0A221W816_9PSEU|nr:aminoglycoside phosphotransferase family protein [Actinoalloteichus hoggarensis]ASO21669.1 Phosphotransferase enzyme family protein [Actinoalloteichus hoggarensis]MBB5922263.1 Ser/Thr protein kinase RdoA (MazF antagonist) [Actinoalloteichus hoggarensis]
MTTRDRVLAHVRERGALDVEPLGAGMEGEVFRLGGGLVGTVWFDRSAEGCRRLGDLYREVAAAGLPFATPEILDVAEVDGSVVTTERLLSGIPLRTAVETGALSVPAALEATAEVVTALGTTTAGPAARAMGLFGSTASPWAGAESWPAAPAATIGDRIALHGRVLRSAVHDFDTLVTTLLARIADLRPGRDAIVHGDVCPENVLVDDAGRVVGLVD